MTAKKCIPCLKKCEKTIKWSEKQKKKKKKSSIAFAKDLIEIWRASGEQREETEGKEEEEEEEEESGKLTSQDKSISAEDRSLLLSALVLA